MLAIDISIAVIFSILKIDIINNGRKINENNTINVSLSKANANNVKTIIVMFTVNRKDANDSNLQSVIIRL